jgi:hypothetical protein
MTCLNGLVYLITNVDFLCNSCTIPIAALHIRYSSTSSGLIWGCGGCAQKPLHPVLTRLRKAIKIAPTSQFFTVDWQATQVGIPLFPESLVKPTNIFVIHLTQRGIRANRTTQNAAQMRGFFLGRIEFGFGLWCWC